MIMTPEEQRDMLAIIKNAKELSNKKTDLVEEILTTAKILAQENEMLKKENMRLEQQLEIAERAVVRLMRKDNESPSN